MSNNTTEHSYIGATTSRIMHLNNLVEAQDYLDINLSPAAVQFLQYVASNDKGRVIASLNELSAILFMPKRTLQRHIDAAVESKLLTATAADTLNLKKTYTLTLPNIIALGGFTNHQADYYCKATGQGAVLGSYLARVNETADLVGALCIVNLDTKRIVHVVKNYRKKVKNRGRIARSRRSQNGKEGSQNCKEGSQNCTRGSQIDHPLIQPNRSVMELKKTNLSESKNERFVDPENTDSNEPESLIEKTDFDQGDLKSPEIKADAAAFDRTLKQGNNTAPTETIPKGDPVAKKEYSTLNPSTARKTNSSEILQTLERGGNIKALSSTSTKAKHSKHSSISAPTIPTGRNKAHLTPTHLNSVLQRLERLTGAKDPSNPYAYGFVSANQFTAVAKKFAGEDGIPDYYTAAKVMTFALTQWVKWNVFTGSNKPKSMISVLWKNNTDALVEFATKYKSTFTKLDFDSLYYNVEKQVDQVAALKEGDNTPKQTVGAPPSRNKPTPPKTDTNAEDDDLDTFLEGLSKQF